MLKMEHKIRKIVAQLVAIIFVFATVIGTLPSKAFAADTTQVKVHYYRFDNGYTNWNLWVWDKTNGTAGAQQDFKSEDDFGKVADITIPAKTSEIGFIVRKGSWEEKDVSKDRVINKIEANKAEVWLIQGDENIYYSEPKKLLKLKANLDAKKTITVKLQKAIKLTGKGDEGFKVLENGDKETPIKITAVKNAVETKVADASAKTPEQRGYELTDNGNKIKFICKSGNFGFKDTTGKLDVYVSGGMNDWGGTSGSTAKYAPLADWKMTWNSTAGQYELIKDIGTGKTDVAIGGKFKFTSYDGTDATWYPAGMGGDNLIEKVSSTDIDPNLTDIVKIYVETPIDVTSYYTVTKDGYKDATVTPRKVLDSDEYVYTKDDLGAVYSKKATTFKVWAPTAGQLTLRLYKNAKVKEYQDIDMTKGGKGVWYLNVNKDLEGYTYQYVVNIQVDGVAKAYVVVDPYSKATTANSDRTLIYDEQKVNANVAGWDKDTYVSNIKNNTDAVLYEAQVRDTSMDKSSGVDEKYRGKYLALTQTGTKSPAGNSTGVDYLKELGITHIHLLPTFDYANGDETESNTKYDWYNWGYDPVLYNNLEGSYATDANTTARQVEYKKMVQSLHNANIGVVVDVVFNHTAKIGDSDKLSIFDKIVPGYYYRITDDGTYSDGSGCGNELASDKPMVRKLILDSVKYWQNQYHIDGFRFDLMSNIDTETMKQVYAQVKKTNPNAIIYGEGWEANPSLLDAKSKTNKDNLKSLNLDIAVFNDETREDVKGNNDGDVKGFVQSGVFRNKEDRFQKEIKGASDFVSSPNQTINYVSCHDNLILWDKISKSLPKATDETKVKVSNLANAIILTAQGVPFIHQGTEFGRTKNGNSNTYNSLTDNNIDWSYRDKNSSMVKYTEGLIALRKAHPAFRMTDAAKVNSSIEFAQKHPDGICEYVIKNNANGDSWKNILVIYNGNSEDKKINATGDWKIVVNDKAAGTDVIATEKDQITVPANSAIVAYTDGDYKLDDNAEIVDKSTTATSGVCVVKVGGVTLNVTMPATTGNDDVYMVGDFNSWNVKGDENYKLTKQADGTYVVSGKIANGAKFKFVRGTAWDNVEKKDATNTEIDNRVFDANTANQNLTIVKWADK